ncbi:hypothetical protein QJS10_CPB18g00358 [Acorus calamus]|uniref:Pectinesterase inhibitor domain-containing protein n=1 Tax=Acorus calamus TaxID=4465 RepID=A0AAV9CK78_ACOCL|nr:hypothetical protein QJS10_CPB18g00358 [Acorus calamus]
MACDLRLPLALLLAISAVRSSSGDANFIMQTCKQTQTSDKCVSLLQSDKRSFNVTTVQALTQISLDLTTTKTSQVSSTLSTLKDQHTGEAIAEPLGQCAELYSHAVDDLQDAAENVGSQSYEAASTLVEDALNTPDSCEKAFGEGMKSPVTQDAQIVKDDLSVTSNLLDLLSA